MPKISVIIPIYNMEMYVSKCIETVCGQTYDDLEILCVNGTSTDNSRNILEEYANKDKRIKIIDVPNDGVSNSRNKGLDIATGEYVMFVDADDWLELDTCEKAMQEIEEEKVDVVMWSYVREFSNQSLPKTIYSEPKKLFVGDGAIMQLHRRFIGLVGSEMKNVENADALCTVWGKLYRRDIIEKEKIRFVDIREIGTYEDGLFNLYVFENVKKAVFINYNYYHYRRDNNTSITSLYKPDLFEQWKRLFSHMDSYIKENDLPDIYRVALNNRICLSILGQGLNVLNDNNCIEKIKEILSDNVYREAYKEFSLKYFPIHWKLFYGCAKYNFATGVYILLGCIQKLRGK